MRTLTAVTPRKKRADSEHEALVAPPRQHEQGAGRDARGLETLVELLERPQVPRDGAERMVARDAHEDFLPHLRRRVGKPLHAAVPATAITTPAVRVPMSAPASTSKG